MKTTALKGFLPECAPVPNFTSLPTHDLLSSRYYSSSSFPAFLLLRPQSLNPFTFLSLPMTTPISLTSSSLAWSVFCLIHLSLKPHFCFSIDPLFTHIPPSKYFRLPQAASCVPDTQSVLISDSETSLTQFASSSTFLPSFNSSPGLFNQP